jgi:hypothetical protein
MHRLERWRPLIQGTTTEAQLLAVMREYCASWLPSEIAKLPGNAPRFQVDSGDDIAGLALDFTAFELKYDGPEEVRDLLRDLALVFTAASQQMNRFRPGPLA